MAVYPCMEWIQIKKKKQPQQQQQQQQLAKLPILETTLPTAVKLT